MEAMRQVWRPLGSLLVAQGVVSSAEVEEALAEQERDGGPLGEILIALGYASRVSIMDALAEQAGLLLEPERGFGSGLRGQIERRHRAVRGRPHAAEGEVATGDDTDPYASLLDRAQETAASHEQRAPTTDERATAPHERAPEPPREPEPAPDDGVGHEFLAAAERARRHLELRRAALSALPSR